MLDLQAVERLIAQASQAAGKDLGRSMAASDDLATATDRLESAMERIAQALAARPQVATAAAEASGESAEERLRAIAARLDHLIALVQGALAGAEVSRVTEGETSASAEPDPDLD
jgi:hypothetical protein